MNVIIACTVDETCGIDDDVRSLPNSEQEVMDWTQLQPLVEQCAKRTSWKYRKYVEYDDVAQSGWLYYFENRKTLDALPRDTFGLMFIKRRIQSACNEYALREMCHKTGVQWEDQYRYGSGEVRFLIRLVFAGGLQGGERSDQVAGYVDVKNALDSADPSDKALLWSHYGPAGEQDQDGVLTSTERGRVHRAVRRIQEILNGENPV